MVVGAGKPSRILIAHHNPGGILNSQDLQALSGENKSEVESFLNLLDGGGDGDPGWA